MNTKPCCSHRRRALALWIAAMLVSVVLSSCSWQKEDSGEMDAMRAKAPPADPSAIVSDDFHSPPAAPWVWIRENPANHRTDRGLHIRLEPGGLMGRGRDAKNILVRPLEPGAVSASVHVDSRHETQYEQAGLIVYTDDDNYVKLVRECVDGETWIILVVEIAAKAKVVSKIPLPPGKTYVGCNFTSTGVDAFCWGDEPALTEVGSVEFPLEPRPMIGVFTQSGQADAERWAFFTDFRLSTEPVKPRALP